MAVLTPDGAIKSRFAELVELLTGQGAVCPLSPKPKRVIPVVPGELSSWDDCCDGQLGLRVASMTPKLNAQGSRALFGQPCNIEYWIISAEIEVIRCAASQNDAGQAPSVQQVTANGNQGLSDMNQMLKALTSAGWVRSIDSFRETGPQGGCFASLWTFTFIVDAVPCD